MINVYNYLRAFDRCGYKPKVLIVYDHETYGIWLCKMFLPRGERYRPPRWILGHYGHSAENDSFLEEFGEHNDVEKISEARLKEFAKNVMADWGLSESDMRRLLQASIKEGKEYEVMLAAMEEK